MVWKNGKFKFGDLSMKPRKKPMAACARKGVNLFTEAPCVFKAKAVRKTARVVPMKKFKEIVKIAIRFERLFFRMMGFTQNVVVACLHCLQVSC